MPAWAAEGMLGIFHMFKVNGATSLVLDTVERITGRPARTLDAYIKENLAVFRPKEPVPVKR